MIEWRKFCDGASDIKLDDAGLAVQFSNGRMQRIDVRPSDGAIELRSVVARRSVADQIEDVATIACDRNRAGNLVAFRLDDRGRLVGESWMPTLGLTREEFLLYVRTTAAACDLFEFLLTGDDRE